MNRLRSLSKPQLVIVPDDRVGQRLDNFLLGLLKGLPKSRLYRLLRKGEIRVNKGRCKPEYRLAAGDQIRLPPLRLEPDASPKPVPKSLQMELQARIVEMGSGWLALNKPSGIAVHGGSGLSFGVIEILRSMSQFKDASLELVHRLDRDTSGLLLVATRRSRLRWFHEQLREKKMRKTYTCVVHGKWPPKVALVDDPICRSTGGGGERIMRIAEKGDRDAKEAQTRFKVCKYGDDLTLLQAEPLTGRTHQIRVHCAAVGHPIVGDNKYRVEQSQRDVERSLGVKRLCLHANRLVFLEKPAGPQIVLDCPPDEGWRSMVSGQKPSLQEEGRS